MYSDCLSYVHEEMCITSCCLTNIFNVIKRFLLNVYMQALLKTLILERSVRWGMQHEIGFSQWDPKTKFGGPAGGSPKGGTRIKNVGSSTLKNLRSVLESHKFWESWKENRNFILHESPTVIWGAKPFCYQENVSFLLAPTRVFSRTTELCDTSVYSCCCLA